MGFQIKFNNGSIDRAEKEFKKKFDRLLNNKQMMTEIGDIAKQDIKFQTRRGNSIPKGMTKFKPLSNKWVEMRKKMKKDNPIHETFSIRRSNLTITGQLLDSMFYDITGKGTLKFGFKGTHEPYNIRRKISRRNYVISQIGKPISNEKLAGYVSKARPFMGVRPQIVARMQKIVIEYIRRSTSI